MGIIMSGIDHTKAGVDIRSVFSFTKKKTGELYEAIRNIPGISGCVILSTCNRMEIWLSSADEPSVSPMELLCSLLELDAKEYETYFNGSLGAAHRVDDGERRTAGPTGDASPVQLQQSFVGKPCGTYVHVLAPTLSTGCPEHPAHVAVLRQTARQVRY